MIAYRRNTYLNIFSCPPPPFCNTEHEARNLTRPSFKMNCLAVWRRGFVHCRPPPPPHTHTRPAFSTPPSLPSPDVFTCARFVSDATLRRLPGFPMLGAGSRSLRGQRKVSAKKNWENFARLTSRGRSDALVMCPYDVTGEDK